MILPISTPSSLRGISFQTNCHALVARRPASLTVAVYCERTIAHTKSRIQFACFNVHTFVIGGGGANGAACVRACEHPHTAAALPKRFKRAIAAEFAKCYLSDRFEPMENSKGIRRTPHNAFAPRPPRANDQVRVN